MTERKAGTKVDLKKQFADLYSPSTKEVAVVEVPAMPFLMIDGAGNPNTSQDYQQAVEALYGVAYALKFLLKKEQSMNYTVMPLEGLWWAPDMREFSVEHKETWLWTMMIAQPEEVTAVLFERAREQVRRKKDAPALAKLRLELFHEGLAAHTFVLFDIGPGAARRVELEHLPLGQLRAVFLTHVHSDHIGDLGDVEDRSWRAGRAWPLDVYGPTGTEQVAQGFQQAYALDAKFRKTSRRMRGYTWRSEEVLWKGGTSYDEQKFGDVCQPAGDMASFCVHIHFDLCNRVVHGKKTYTQNCSPIGDPWLEEEPRERIMQTAREARIFFSREQN